MISVSLFTVMKVGNKISVKTMQLLRKYLRRSECNLRRQNLQNITGQMTVINSNALGT